MPTYEFRAPDGTIVERIFKISEVPESIELPDGQGVAVRIISGGAGLLFKGSGFYITDYGKDGKKDQRPASTDAKSEAKSESKSETKAETKSETKSASSSDAKPAAS